MWDYISGLLFLIWMIALSYLFGFSIRKEHNFSTNLITGYIGYSFIIGLGLMVIELFDVPWMFALIYFFLTIIFILFYIIYSIKKNKLKITKEDIKNLFQENYFLFIIVLILMFISVISFSVYWLNNHLDDGYYLSKIVKMPYLDTPYSYDYPVNCYAKSMLSYRINTWELESSIYVYLLKINVFVYCRLFLNFFNYLLFCSTISLLTTKIYKKLNLSNDRFKFIQYIPIVIIFFATNMNTVYQIGFMHLIDHWQFVTAMYFGSSIPRTMGILWIMMTFVENDKITIKDIFKLFMISVVLMSKSSIALPIIVLTSVTLYFIINFNKERKVIFLLIPLLIYVVVGIILPNNLGIQSEIYSLLTQNVKTLPFLVSLVVLVISFTFRNSFVNRINFTLIFIFALMMIPEINDVFENFSIYNFVSNRMFTTLMYTFYIVAFSYVAYFFMSHVHKNILKPVFLILTCIITGSSILTYTGRNMTIKNSLIVIAQNKKMVPNSTLELGNALDKISKEKGTLRILSPEFVFANGVPHPLATILTTVSSDTISYSAIPRYYVDSDDEIASYKYEYQELFHTFNDTKSDDDFNNCIKFINKYGINSFILFGDTSKHDSYGDFKKVQTIIDQNASVYYSIYVKG